MQGPPSPLARHGLSSGGPGRSAAHQSSSATLFQSSPSCRSGRAAPSSRVGEDDGAEGAAEAPPDAASEERCGRRSTRKGTETVGAGSPGARSGPAWVQPSHSLAGRCGPSVSGTELVRARPSGSSGANQGSRGSCADAVPRPRRRRPPWRRARAVAVPLSRAPPAPPAASQTPSGRAGERLVSTRTETSGLGLRAASSSTASRGASRGSSSRRRRRVRAGTGIGKKGSGGQRPGPAASVPRIGPSQRRSAPSSSPRLSNTRITRKSTISSSVVGL